VLAKLACGTERGTLAALQFDWDCPVHSLRLGHCARRRTRFRGAQRECTAASMVAMLPLLLSLRHARYTQHNVRP